MKKILSLLSALAIFMGCAAPVSAADTLADKQQAIVETAKAFYLKGDKMQYDSVVMTNITANDAVSPRSTNFITPEDATSQRTLYTVCSSYVFEVYRNALGYEFYGDRKLMYTSYMYHKSPKEMVALHYEAAADGEDKRRENIEKVLAALQLGDVIVYLNTSGAGHAMLYVGDANGDGKGDLLHSTSAGGGKYDMATGVDKVESSGSIHMDTAETFLPGALKSGKGFCLLRPLQMKELEKFPVTDSAHTRMQYPGMAIERTVSVGRHGSATVGGTLTYTITINNDSDKAYAGLAVEENVPAGATLVSADGAAVSGKTNLNWTLDIPAGEKRTLTYEVKTDTLGAYIVNDGGRVAGIPSNSLRTTVGGKAVDSVRLRNLETYAAFVEASAKSGLDFAEAVYHYALDIDLSLPTVEEIGASVLRRDKEFGMLAYQYAETPKAGYETAHAMLVRDFWGGKDFLTPGAQEGPGNCERVMRPVKSDLEAGDILLVSASPISDANAAVYVYNGEKLLYLKDGKLAAVNPAAVLNKILIHDLFLLLRPRQAYADITSEAMKLSFTDVDYSDWYYPYVRDLVHSGTVAGMTANTFAPKGGLTWGQALKLIALAVGESEQAAGSHWASGYMALAKDKGWIGGDVDLNAGITRLELCKVAAKAKGLTQQPASNPFTDCSDPSVLALVNAGVIHGMTETTFQPSGLLTRAQIVKIIWCMNRA